MHTCVRDVESGNNMIYGSYIESPTILLPDINLLISYLVSRQPIKVLILHVSIMECTKLCSLGMCTGHHNS